MSAVADQPKLVRDLSERLDRVIGELEQRTNDARALEHFKNARRQIQDATNDDPDRQAPTDRSAS